MPLTILQAAYAFAPVGPRAVGGAEEILGALDRALVANGDQSFVVACEGSEAAGELFPVPLPHENLGQLSANAQLLARAEYQAALDRALASTRVDLLHMHGLDFHHYRFPRHIPVLVTLHMPIAWYGADEASDVWSSLGSNVYFQCVSERQLRSCPPHMRPIAVIPNGVETPPLAPRLDPADEDLPKDFALVLGRVCPEKNAVAALRAGTLAGIPVFIGGEVFSYESHQTYFDDEIQPLLNQCEGPRHRFLGPLTKERRQALLARARCLLHPTLAPETSSLVAMEAMAAGTPVIAYASGALPEIVKEGVTGFLVDSPETMAEALGRVSTLSLDVCRFTAMERFRREHMIERYFDLYARLLQLHHKDSCVATAAELAVG